MSQKSILFIYQNYSSFVRSDFEILSAEFRVKKLQFKPSRGLLRTAIEILKQLFYLTAGIQKFDAVYIWFADYHSLLPVALARLFRKKSFLVVGGYDVCRLKKFKYGVFTSKLRGFFAINSMRLASVNLTVSAHVDRKVKFICPEARRKMVFNCVNIKSEKRLLSKKRMVLTVALLDTERTFYMKGIDLFTDVARLLPEYEFVIVGFNWSQLAHKLGNKPKNLSTYEKIPHEELNRFYDETQFYCQLSFFESFGVSIAEAMMHGCIPLVTNGGAMPEIVGDSRYIVTRNKDIIAQTIRQLSSSISQEDIDKLRARVNNLFSFETRKQLLISELKHKLYGNLPAN